MSNTINDSASSGMLGGQVSVRNVGTRLVVKSRSPKKRLRKPVDKSAVDKFEKVKEKFLDAVQYAKGQTVDPESESNKLYMTGITGRKRSAYMVAMCDYLVAPQVLQIDTLNYKGAKGDIISVKAKDDFMVTNVKVLITDAQGAEVEEGDAIPAPIKVGLWEYKAKTALADLAGTTIRAIAYDRPGNTGTLEVKL